MTGRHLKMINLMQFLLISDFDRSDIICFSDWSVGDSDI